MKLYEFLAHVYLDFSRFFRSASLGVLQRQENRGDAHAAYLAGEVNVLVGPVKDAIGNFERAARQGAVEAQIALANHYEEADNQNEVTRAHAMEMLQLAIDNPSLRTHFPNEPKISDYLCRRQARLKQAIHPACLIYIDHIRNEIAARAKRGNPEANYQMGMFHYYGRPQAFGYIAGGGETAAAPFWTAAAERGHVDSQLLLAYFGSEPWLRRAATDGHRGAQRELAHLLYQQASELWAASQSEGTRSSRERRKPVSTNPSMMTEAIAWRRSAAEKGCGESAAWLASIYQQTYWVEQDLKESFAWRRKAAAAGWPTGLALANCYYMGIGTQQCMADALRWYIAAALSGDVDAMLSLGHIYAQGKDVARDLAEAARWFDRAVEKKLQELTADIRRDYHYEYPSEIYSGLQCSFICREALSGSNAAIEIINEYYQQPEPDEKIFNSPIHAYIDAGNFSSTFYFLRENESFRERLVEWASVGIQAAQVVLGESPFGESSNKDSSDRRIHYLKQAAGQGNIYALHLLGDMDHHPSDDGGVQPSEDPTAAEWYNRAAAIGDLEAKFKVAFLGEMAICENKPAEWGPDEQADFIEDNLEFQRVLGLYRELAELEHPRAQMRLAALLDGSSFAFYRRRTQLKECKAAQREAAYWLRKSAENGYARAAYKLAQLLDAAREEWLPHSHEVIRWYRFAAMGRERNACHDLHYAYLIGRGVPQDASEAMYWKRVYNRLS